MWVRVQREGQGHGLAVGGQGLQAGRGDGPRSRAVLRTQAVESGTTWGEGWEGRCWPVCRQVQMTRGCSCEGWHERLPSPWEVNLPYREFYLICHRLLQGLHVLPGQRQRESLSLGDDLSEIPTVLLSQGTHRCLCCSIPLGRACSGWWEQSWKVGEVGRSKAGPGAGQREGNSAENGGSS